MMIQPAARSSSSQAPQLPEHSGRAPHSSVITPQCFFWPPGSVFEPQQARYDRQDEHLACSNLVAFQDHLQGEHLKADCCSCTTMHSAPTLLYLHSHHNPGASSRPVILWKHAGDTNAPVATASSSEERGLCLKACTLCSSYAGSRTRVGSLRLLVEKS